MCRTDLAIRRSDGRSPLPGVLGHQEAEAEAEAEVRMGGPDTAIGVGDHVVLSFDAG